MQTLAIKPYLPEQLKFEEDYYNKLQLLISPLINMMVNYVDSKHVRLRELDALYNNWYDANIQLLRKINGAHAIDVLKIAQYATSSIMSISPTQAHNLTTDLNIHSENMLNAIKGRFIELIPVGIFIAAYSLFTDETSKAAIIRRSNYSINSYVQTNTTSGVIQSIFQEGRMQGMSEYQADNQHDDRVRETHKEYFDGEKWWPFDSPSPVGHPGSETNCRCIIIKLR